MNSVHDPTEPKRASTKATRRITELEEHIGFLDWVIEDLNEDVAEMESLLRTIREMLRSKQPDLEYMELLIDRKIGSF